jgi:hypothetical protein
MTTQDALIAHPHSELESFTIVDCVAHLAYVL